MHMLSNVISITKSGAKKLIQSVKKQNVKDSLNSKKLFYLDLKYIWFDVQKEQNFVAKVHHCKLSSHVYQVF